MNREESDRIEREQQAARSRTTRVTPATPSEPPETSSKRQARAWAQWTREISDVINRIGEEVEDHARRLSEIKQPETSSAYCRFEGCPEVEPHTHGTDPDPEHLTAETYNEHGDVMSHEIIPETRTTASTTRARIEDPECGHLAPERRGDGSTVKGITCTFPAGHRKIILTSTGAQQVLQGWAAKNPSVGYDHGAGMTAWMEKAPEPTAKQYSRKVPCGVHHPSKSITCTQPAGHEGAHQRVESGEITAAWSSEWAGIEIEQHPEKLPNNSEHQEELSVNHPSRAQGALSANSQPTDEQPAQTRLSVEQARETTSPEERAAAQHHAALWLDAQREAIRRMIAWRRSKGQAQCKVRSTVTINGTPTRREHRCALQEGHKGPHYLDPDWMAGEVLSPTEQALGAPSSPSAGDQPAGSRVVSEAGDGSEQCGAEWSAFDVALKCMLRAGHAGLHTDQFQGQAPVQWADQPISVRETEQHPQSETQNLKERDMQKTIETSGQIAGAGKISTAEIIEVLSAHVPSNAHPEIEQHTATDQRDENRWIIRWASRTSS